MDFDAQLLERAKSFIPSYSRRDTGLQVITCGLGRSGTTSLSVALSILGFGPAHHFQSLLFDASLSRKWIAALAAVSAGEVVSREQWDDIFHGFGSAVGTPACYVADVLATTYPDAKVIINRRDFEDWQRSVLQNLKNASPRVGWVWRVLVPSVRARAALWRQQQRVTGLQEACYAPDPSAELRRIYDSHYARMRDNIAVERCLEWNISDGWEPLCEFLGVPVPKQPFPHVHSTAEFKEKRQRVDPVVRKIARENAIWLAKTGAVTVAALVTLGCIVRKTYLWTL